MGYSKLLETVSTTEGTMIAEFGLLIIRNLRVLRVFVVENPSLLLGL
jgi:hypothetical protein